MSDFVVPPSDPFFLLLPKKIESGKVEQHESILNRFLHDKLFIPLFSLCDYLSIDYHIDSSKESNERDVPKQVIEDTRRPKVAHHERRLSRRTGRLRFAHGSFVRPAAFEPGKIFTTYHATRVTDDDPRAEPQKAADAASRGGGPNHGIIFVFGAIGQHLVSVFVRLYSMCMCVCVFMR